MARRFYSSVAQRTTLADQVDATTGTFIVNGVTGWPANTPYTLLIDADTVNEEIVEVTARAGSTLTVVRGVDGSTGKPHDAGADVRHGVSARDFDEPNAFINGTGYRYNSTVYFTSNGTFTKADYPWLRAIRVRLVGAGGGGGGCLDTGATVAAIASGGGGGAYAESFITNISGLSASVTVTVGAGGAGGAAGNNNGTAGGNSSFGALVSANGGNGGTGSNAAAAPNFTAGGGGGASTGTGDLVIGGGLSTGQLIILNTFVYEDPGGGSHLGRFGTRNISAAGFNGTAGPSYGVGGGGGGNAQNQATARAGGAGGAGIVIVELYA
jgi:hypothetical protein